jgi:hypothetical protein
MKGIKRYGLSTIVLLLLINGIFAQNHSASAQLDSNNILIGDQVNLILRFSSNENVSAIFPAYCDTCIAGVEIVRRFPTDTLHKENEIVLQQKWVITSFDSGTYVLPSFSFYGLDSALLAQTESLLLHVQTIPIDTALAIKDIKEPLSAPITLREIVPFIIIILLAVGVIVGIIFFIRYINKKKKPQSVQKEKPKLAAHIIALQELDRLWNKKLCQSGHVKQHYSELTDIVRTYMENRWDIMAMEMVSSEIVEALDPLHLPTDVMRKLEQTLYLADMVKFAKANPLPDENNMSYRNIVEFVETTKETATQNNLS